MLSGAKQEGTEPHEALPQPVAAPIENRDEQVVAAPVEPQREAKALRDLIGKFVTDIPVNIHPTTKPGVYEASYRVKDGAGSQHELDTRAASEMEVLNMAIGGIAKGQTLIQQNEEPIGVRTINDDSMNDRVDRSIIFTPDHDKLFALALGISAKSLERIVKQQELDAGFQVKPRVDRDAVYLEGNDTKARGMLKKAFGACGITCTDKRRGNMNIINVPIPRDNFAGMVDVLEKLQLVGRAMKHAAQSAAAAQVEAEGVPENQVKLAGLVRKVTGLGANIPDTVMVNFDANINIFMLSVPNGHAVNTLAQALNNAGVMAAIGKTGKETTPVQVSMMYVISDTEDTHAAVVMGLYTQQELGSIVDRVAESIPKAIGQGGVSGREDTRDAERRDKKNEL
jgi:hypothetical protein